MLIYQSLMGNEPDDYNRCELDLTKYAITITLPKFMGQISIPGQIATLIFLLMLMLGASFEDLQDTMTSSSLCPNCSAPLNGHFCSNCGQNQKSIHRFFLTLINEAFDDIFKADSRPWKTLVGLLFRPGFLSNEYFRGRRASYIQPIRLYFISSILFFVVLSIINFFSGPDSITVIDGDQSQVQQGESPPQTDISADETSENIAGEAVVTPENAAQITPGLSQKEQEELDDITISIPFVSEETEEMLADRFRDRIENAVELAQQDSRVMISAILELAPPVIFCLLPLFALLLKLAYVTKGFYYTEHFIFALHNHAFVFQSLTLYAIMEMLLRNYPAVEAWLGFIILWIPIYLWLSLKRVFRQGSLLTTVKFLFLGFTYTAILGAGILVTLLVGIMTL